MLIVRDERQAEAVNMPLRIKNRLLFIVLICLPMLAFPDSLLLAQDLLEDSGGYAKSYIIEMSGKVLNERFAKAMASLEISLPNPDSLNPYLVVVRGFPKSNSRNIFYWHSDGSDMSAMPQEITCDIKRTYLRPGKLEYQCHFFYISPIIVKPIKGMFLTPREKERKKTAEERALPTRVYAQAGQLKIRFYSDMVSGSVWMKGYDLIEHSYVEYNATFSGMKATRLEPKWQIKEPRRNTGVFMEMHLKYK